MVECIKRHISNCFAGYFSWKVCNFHVNNVAAKKPNGARRGGEMMFAACLKHKVYYTSGDANQSVVRGYLQEGLQSALDKYNAAEGLSDDVAVGAEVHKGDDVIVGIVFSWESFKPKRVRMAKHLNLEKCDLYLRPGDKDAHTPLKMFFADHRTKRDRSQFMQAFRMNNDRLRERKRHAGTSNSAYEGDEGGVSDAA